MFKVVLVEDEPAILKNLKMKIENLNLENFLITDTAFSAEEAWKKIQVNVPNLVISDIKMAGKGGIWLFQQIRNKYEDDIICIALSAYNDFNCLQQCIRIGIDDYFLKPISIMKLEKKFKEIEQILIEKNKTLMNTEIEGDKKNSVKNDEENLYDQIDQYIEKNYMKKIQLKQLAQEFNYSSQYLCEIYKKNKEITLGEAITKTKIDKAVELIENQNEISLADVSESVGYNDYKYFGRVFKKLMGITVTEYKSNIQKTKQRT